MDIASLIAEIAQDLLMFIGAMVVILVALVVTVSLLPAGNPLKRILVALSWRIGAMLGVGVVAVPVEPIPGVDVAYDVGAAVLLIAYWILFFRDVLRILSGTDAQGRRGAT